MMSALRLGRYSAINVATNWSPTTIASGRLYVARNLRTSVINMWLLLSPCSDPREEEVGDLLRAERRSHSELGAAGPEDEAAQGDRGDLGLDRELVAVLLEDARQPAVELGLGLDHELRRAEVLLVVPVQLLGPHQVAA